MRKILKKSAWLWGWLKATITAPRAITAGGNTNRAKKAMADPGGAAAVPARHGGLAKRSRTCDTETGIADADMRRREAAPGGFELKEKT